MRSTMPWALLATQMSGVQCLLWSLGTADTGNPWQSLRHQDYVAVSYPNVRCAVPDMSSGAAEQRGTILGKMWFYGFSLHRGWVQTSRRRCWHQGSGCRFHHGEQKRRYQFPWSEYQTFISKAHSDSPCEATARNKGPGTSSSICACTLQPHRCWKVARRDDSEHGWLQSLSWVTWRCQSEQYSDWRFINTRSFLMSDTLTRKETTSWKSCSTLRRHIVWCFTNKLYLWNRVSPARWSLHCCLSSFEVAVCLYKSDKRWYNFLWAKSKGSCIVFSRVIRHIE